METTLLIDADIIAFQCSASKERKYDWGDGVTSISADLDEAIEAASDTLEDLVVKLKANNLIICLSDEVNNFRNDVLPSYKGNRAGTERPQQLYEVKEWLAIEFTSKMIPTLEADDVMGILATEPHEGKRIIVSDDKDMQTVPCYFYRPCRNRSEVASKNEGVRLISPEEAERFHLWQTLCGDTTDHYFGCPGIGPVAAESILDGQGFESYIHTFKSGPRKGLEEVRWRKVDGMDRWAAIVSAYEKAGLTEQDAIVQANCARILKVGDFDGNRAIPWVPA